MWATWCDGLLEIERNETTVLQDVEKVKKTFGVANVVALED